MSENKREQGRVSERVSTREGGGGARRAKEIVREAEGRARLAREGRGE